jgi:dolichol-phosphate mannosyltransferase
MQFAIEHKYALWIAMDADFSHPPEQLPKMVGTIGNLESPDFDCVIGSRYINGGGVVGWPWSRRFMSRGVNLYARLLLGLKPRDCSGAYRCCRVEMLSQLDFSQFLSHGYSFMEEFLWRLKKLNVRIAEIPIIFTDREHGASKLNKREAIHSLWILFKLGLQNWLCKN